MLASIFSLNVIQTALELGCIYALVALALFLSYSILNIADLSTDGCFTLGCAVACQVALTNSRNYKDMRECHIQPDWLLVYKIERDALILKLIRTGSHSDLF